MSETDRSHAEIVGQDHVISALARAVHAGRLAHALLFCGPDGVGRESTARALARGRLCERNDDDEPKLFGCRRCGACIRVDAGTHPDLAWLLPQDQAIARGLADPLPSSKTPSREIRIDDVRALTTRLRKHSFEGRARVVVVLDAHRMNPSAANAFLKTLEEPPPGTLLVLVAPQPRLLLPTIVSRCQTLRFAPLSDDSLRTILSCAGVEDLESRVALAEGSAARARNADLDAGAERLADARDLLAALVEQAPGDRLTYLETLGRDRGVVDGALAALSTAIAAGLRAAVAEGRTSMTLLDVELRVVDATGLIEAIEAARDAVRANVQVALALEELGFESVPRLGLPSRR